MKALLISVLMLSCCAAADRGANLPLFDQKISVPELSLRESLRQNLLPVAEDLPKVGGLVLNSNAAAEAAKMISHMPVIIPKAEVGSTIRVVRPDSSVDHKIITREPLSDYPGEVQVTNEIKGGRMLVSSEKRR